MGNCQAIDAAVLVIQHPNGRMERMYWSVSASEVMKMNPGLYVSLIIPLPDDREENSDERAVRFTRVKLLRPSDSLVLGRAYRLVTTQEVMKVLRAKKYAKMKKNMSESSEMKETEPENLNSSCDAEARFGLNRHSQEVGNDQREQQKPGAATFAAARSKSWRPSLQSISEAAS